MFKINAFLFQLKVHLAVDVVVLSLCVIEMLANVIFAVHFFKNKEGLII
jgi:hypothetical protein